MIALLLLAAALIQSAPPDTEIYLATLSIASGKIGIGQPTNISNNPGYDNQPSFTPDGAAILFTSVRGGRNPDSANGAASGSDIYRFDIAASRVQQITDTPESEYSPTVMPDGAHFSTVRVEADGTQRLWRFDMDGRRPALVLPDLKPVGYHAWLAPQTLALFVLGTPPTLRLADAATGKADTVVSGINRSLQRMPDGRVSFVVRETGEGAAPVLIIKALDVSTRATSTLVRAPTGATEADTAWTPDGTLLVASGGRLYSWRAGQNAMSGAADLEALGLKGVTRLAVSPSGNRIAIVAQPR